MKTKTLSLSSILGFLGLLLILHTFKSYAGTNAITCATAFGEKSFTIENDKVSFHKTDESGAERSISSLGSDSVRTQSSHKGFIKTLYIEGNKHKIKIQNVSEFTENDDYLSITSPKGHEMTYPLYCHSV